MSRVLVLVNEKSGGVSRLGAERCLSEIDEALGGEEISVESVEGDPSPLVDRARSVAQEKSLTKILLLAGDGTAAAIAGALAHTPVQLAVLPGGTMNAFSRDLGFDPDLSTAIKQLSSVKEQTVDVGYANGMPFLNNIVFGAYSIVAQAREHFREVETIGEKAESIQEILGSIAYPDAERYTISEEGAAKCIETNTFMVSNNCYNDTDIMLPRRSCLDSGELCLYVSQSKTAADFIALLIEAVTRPLEESALFSISRCKQCSISVATDLLEFAIDGEAREIASPLKVEIKPGALRVLAPKNKISG
jgi:diacylglycerol kinase family enzyme